MTTGILADELEKAAADGGRAHVDGGISINGFLFLCVCRECKCTY